MKVNFTPAVAESKFLAPLHRYEKSCACVKKILLRCFIQKLSQKLTQDKARRDEKCQILVSSRLN